MSLVGKLLHSLASSRAPKAMARVEANAAKLNAQPPADFSAITSKYEDGAHLPARPLEVPGAEQLTPSSRPPPSLDYEKLDHQGRRFLSGGRTAAQLEAETGQPAVEPKRLYAALSHGSTIEARVSALVEAAKRKGPDGTSAFDRGTLVLTAGTGSGFVEPVGVNAVESFAHGDVATLAFQYNDQPSTNSAPEVPEATREFEQLLVAVNAELEKRRARGETVPRLVVLGESLGAAVAEAALRPHYGELRTPGSKYHVDAMLLCGLPGFRELPGDVVTGQGKDGFIARLDPQRPESTWAQSSYAVANNGDDPVPHIGDWSTLVQRPADWPEDKRFFPLVSMLQMVKGLPVSTHPEAGKFNEAAHDYRARKVELVAKYVFGGAPAAALVDRVNGRQRELEAARGEMIEAQVNWDQLQTKGTP